MNLAVWGVKLLSVNKGLTDFGLGAGFGQEAVRSSLDSLLQTAHELGLGQARRQGIEDLHNDGARLSPPGTARPKHP